MDQNRRKFLKSSAVVAGGLLSTSSRDAFAQAKNASPATDQPKLEVAKAMTLAMLQTPTGLSLGVRAGNGDIIDVGGAERAFKLGAPGSTDQIIGGDYDAKALKATLDKARAAGRKYL
ncbi:MAG: hypothetical protein QOH32_3123, partial [Bradyrhizobium sp.]|nr:hypothetical protein [Bradyrhizobium sp.]